MVIAGQKHSLKHDSNPNTLPSSKVRMGGRPRLNSYRYLKISCSKLRSLNSDVLMSLKGCNGFQYPKLDTICVQLANYVLIWTGQSKQKCLKRLILFFLVQPGLYHLNSSLKHYMYTRVSFPPFCSQFTIFVKMGVLVLHFVSLSVRQSVTLLLAR